MTGTGTSVTLLDPDTGSDGIRADVDGVTSIGSLRLELSGANTANRTENVAPYSLYGDSNQGGPSLTQAAT